MKTSPFGTLSIGDVGRGILMTIGTTFLGGIGTSIATGSLPTLHSIEGIGLMGLSSGIFYLIKNLATNSSGEILIKEPTTIYTEPTKTGNQ